MDLTERMIESKEVYNGLVVNVKLDRVTVPNGKYSLREVVVHPGGVVILPLDEKNNVVTVTQFRYAFGQALLEIPAGKMEPGENPRQSALRELKEEVGITPDELISMGSIYSSPGFCSEELHLFLARGLNEGKADPDEDEFLIVERIPIGELVGKIMAGEVRDGKTVAAVLKAKQYLKL